MDTWFECGIRYPKTMENGLIKKVTETYVVPALSFSEAEAVIIKEISPYMHDDYLVSSIKRANYSEIFRDSESDIWFKCKVNFVTLNEKTGKEKKTPCYMLVQSQSMEDASKRLNTELKTSVTDYQIATIQETNILDVYE